jgi:hypothetical protein
MEKRVDPDQNGSQGAHVSRHAPDAAIASPGSADNFFGFNDPDHGLGILEWSRNSGPVGSCSSFYLAKLLITAWREYALSGCHPVSLSDT